MLCAGSGCKLSFLSAVFPKLSSKYRYYACASVWYSTHVRSPIFLNKSTLYAKLKFLSTLLHSQTYETEQKLFTGDETKIDMLMSAFVRGN